MKRILVQRFFKRTIYNYSLGSKSSNTFKPVINFDQIKSSLSEISDPKEILDIYSSNQSFFQTSDLIFVLRMVCRTLRPFKNIESSEENAIIRDERLSKLFEKLSPFILNIDHSEIADMLFCLRKLKASSKDWELKIPKNVFLEMMRNLENFLKDNKYNLREMIFLYYDLSFMKRTSEILVEKLILKLDQSMDVDQSILIQFLQAISARNTSTIGMREWNMIDLAMKLTEKSYSRFEIQKKAFIFKYVSMIELQYNPPRYSYPYFMIPLREDLKANIEEINENTVIAIIQAYQYLPSNYFQDLLLETIETLVQYKNMMSTKFFIEIILEIEKIKNQKRKEFLFQKLNFHNDIINKIKNNDEIIMNIKNFQKICEVYLSQNMDLNSLLESFIEVKKEKNDFSINIAFLEYSYLNKKDFHVFLDDFLKNFNEIKISHKVRLYILLKEMKNIKYSKYLQELDNFINETIQKEPLSIINISKDFILDCEPKEKLIIEAVNKALEKIPNNIEENSFARSFVESIQNENLLQFASKWILSQKKLSDLKMNNIFDAFIFINKYNSFQIEFIILFISNFLSKSENISKMLFRIRNGTNLWNHLSNQPYLLTKLVEILRKNLKNTHNHNNKLSSVFALTLRISNIYSYNTQLLKFLSELYNDSLDRNFDRVVTKLIGEFLINNKSLSLKSAEKLILLESSDEFRLSFVLKCKILCCIAEYKGKNIDIDLENQLQNNLSNLIEIIKTLNPNKKLHYISLLTSFPPHMLMKQIDFVMKNFKEAQNKVNAFQFNMFVKVLTHKKLAKNPDVYDSIIREILFVYRNICEKIHSVDPILIFDMLFASEKKYFDKYEMIFKKINHLRIHERFSTNYVILHKIAFLGYLNREFISKMIKSIENSEFLESNILSYMLEDLFKIGYRGPELLDLFEKISKMKSIYKEKANLYYLLMKIIMEKENEQEFLDLKESLSCETDLQKINHRNLLFNYYKIQEKQYKLDEFKMDAMRKLEYLNTGIKNEFLLEGFSIDGLIPDKNIIIKFASNFDFIYINDKTIEFCYYEHDIVKDYGRGNLLISHHLYKKLENYKVIYLNPFKIINYDEKRIMKELNSIGITTKKAPFESVFSSRNAFSEPEIYQDLSEDIFLNL